MRYFQSRLATIPGAGTEEGLRAFFALLTQRLEFIYAQLEGENPFNIFKSLNSTGVPLGQADLIRNFVFMQVPVEDQDDFDEDLWKPIERRFESAQGNIDELDFSAFLRDYLMRNGEYVPPGSTFEAFQRHYDATDFDPKQVAAELKQASEWYEILRGKRTDPNPEVEAALDALRQLESSTTNSRCCSTSTSAATRPLSDRDMAEALRLLAGFILRRLVCGESSRGYGRMFVQAISALGDDLLDSLRQFLEARDFPDTSRFVGAFTFFNLYGSRYRKVVLEALERANGHKEPVVLTNAQVEHIMPQTLSETWRSDLGQDAERIHSTWLHTPGNLTLTGYNPELSNKPFAEKRKEYHHSNIMMTRKFLSMRPGARPRSGNAARRWPRWRRKFGRVRRYPSSGSSKIRRPPRPAFRASSPVLEGLSRALQDVGESHRAPEPQPHYSLPAAGSPPGSPSTLTSAPKDEQIAVSVLFQGKTQREIFHDSSRAPRRHRGRDRGQAGLDTRPGPRCLRDRSPQPCRPDRRATVADVLRLDDAVAGDFPASGRPPHLGGSRPPRR